MASYLANTRLVDHDGAAVQLDPALPVYLYFGAEWSVSLSISAGCSSCSSFSSALTARLSSI